MRAGPAPPPVWERCPLLLAWAVRGSWPHPSLADALRRAGPGPHLGGAGERALVAWVPHAPWPTSHLARGGTALVALVQESGQLY